MKNHFILSSRSESSSSGSRSNADEASPERLQSGKSSKSWADEVEDEEERRETASRQIAD